MDQTTINNALQELAARDEAIAATLPQVGYPAPRLRPEGFATLLSIIVSQQISTDAARAIMHRLKTALPSLSAQQVLASLPETLREAGLSRRKVEYAQGLAEAVVGGSLVIESLASLPDEGVISEISRMRGFGRWSAEIYTMFALQRPDIFPATDLALLSALGRLKGLMAKPTPAQAMALVGHWSPWRSVGALYLWHYYRGAPD